VGHHATTALATSFGGAITTIAIILAVQLPLKLEKTGDTALNIIFIGKMIKIPHGSDNLVPIRFWYFRPRDIKSNTDCVRS
jgi:hypothetical protein